MPSRRPSPTSRPSATGPRRRNNSLTRYEDAVSDTVQTPVKSGGPPPKRPLRARPAAISVTPAAVARVRQLLDKRGKPSAGVRIGVRSRGCSGLSYTLEYADAKGPADEAVEVEGITILI